MAHAWLQENGGLTVHSSTQWTDNMRGIVQEITGLPANKIKVSLSLLLFLLKS